jgi:hypothetical protein
LSPVPERVRGPILTSKDLRLCRLLDVNFGEFLF